MARMIQKKNKTPTPPKPSKTANKIIAAIFFIGTVFCAFSFLAGIAYTVVPAIVLFIGFIISSLTCITLDEDYKSEIEEVGEQGEQIAGSILEKYLPDNYTVIQNLEIFYNDGTSEIDNIVVGNTGVYIIKVKNIKGELIGNYNEKNWIQYKTDQYGIEHTKELYNPVKQVGTHIYRLKNYLKDNKMVLHINGAVYCVNPETVLSIDEEQNKIPIFTYDSTQEMINYIMNGKEKLSEKTIEKIIELLV